MNEIRAGTEHKGMLSVKLEGPQELTREMGKGSRGSCINKGKQSQCKLDKN